MPEKNAFPFAAISRLMVPSLNHPALSRIQQLGTTPLSEVALQGMEIVVDALLPQNIAVCLDRHGNVVGVIKLKEEEETPDHE